MARERRRSPTPSALVGAALVTLLGVGLALWRGSADEPASAAQADARAAPADAVAGDVAPDDDTASVLGAGRATVWVEVVSGEGSAVVGATVTLRAAAGAREQSTDEGGLAVFEGLLPGPYVVEVSALGYERLTTREVLRPGLAEAAWTLRLALDGESAGALRGVVVSAEQPVAGALVAYLQDGEAKAEGAVRTGADGRFVLPRRDRARAVVAFHPERGLAERVFDEDRELLLELPSPGFVEGRVSDDAGRPLETFRVQGIVSELPRGLVRALAAASGGGREGSRAARRALTKPWVAFPAGDDDETGTFRVGPLPAGVVRVVASADGRAPAEREVRVRSGEVTRGVSLVLSGPLVVTGCVTDAKSGEPVRGARVYAMRSEAPDAPGFGFATSDDDGCYRMLTTADVRQSVAVRARGYVATSVGGVLGRADEEVRRDFALVRSRGAHEGYRYVGIGAKLKVHDDGAEVVDVFTSGSAAGAVEAGDVILRVDGVWTEGLPLPRIVEMIVGEDGTEVELLVQPKGGGPVETVVLPRRQQSSRG